MKRLHDHIRGRRNKHSCLERKHPPSRVQSYHFNQRLFQLVLSCSLRSVEKIFTDKHVVWDGKIVWTKECGATFIHHHAVQENITHRNSTRRKSWKKHEKPNQRITGRSEKILNNNPGLILGTNCALNISDCFHPPYSLSLCALVQ